MEKYCTAGQVTDDNITRRMCTECWIHKAANTLSKYVQITAFPRQHGKRESAWMLRYMYIVLLSSPVKVFGTQRAHTLYYSTSSRALSRVVPIANVKARDKLEFRRVAFPQSVSVPVLRCSNHQ